MKVWLLKDWFDETGSLIRKSHNPHEIDDDRLAVLPSTAKVGDKLATAKKVSELRGDAPEAVAESAEVKALRERAEKAEAALAALSGEKEPAKEPEPVPEPVKAVAGLKPKEA